MNRRNWRLLAILALALALVAAACGGDDDEATGGDTGDPLKIAFVNIGPVREDIAELAQAEWLKPRPNTDTAVMLGLAHTLFADGLHDESFLALYAVGFDRFKPYVIG